MSLTTKHTPGESASYDLFLDGVMVGRIVVELDDPDFHGQGSRRVRLIASSLTVREGDVLSRKVLDSSIGVSTLGTIRLDEFDQRQAADYGWVPYTDETFHFPAGFKAGDRVRSYLGEEGMVAVPPEGSPFRGGSIWSVPVVFDSNESASITWTDEQFLEVIS